MKITEVEISELHVGLKGTMNALFLKDLATDLIRGDHEIDEAQAQETSSPGNQRIFRTSTERCPASIGRRSSG